MRRLIIVLFLLLSHHISLSPHSLDLTPANCNQIVPEGLIAGTKVKTIQGYTNIENLTTHDIVIGYDHDHATCYQARVLHIDQTVAPGFVKIKVANETIHAGTHQQFYVPDKKQWVNAEDLCVDDLLCSTISDYALVKSIEYVDQPVTAYRITVEHSHFCITSADILVHNFDPVSSSAAYSAATLVSGANPVSAPIVGTIITVTAIGLAVYKTWRTWSDKHRICPEILPHTPTFIPQCLPKSGLPEHIHYAKKEKSTEDNAPDAKQEPSPKQKPTDNEKDNTNSEKEKLTLDDILRDAQPGRKTKGRSKQFEKPGEFDEALKDFDSLDVLDIKNIPSGRAGVLSDGRDINVRDNSSAEKPTLEIIDKKIDKRIKIRYVN